MSDLKHIPQRKCVGCCQMRDKNSLLRIVNNDGNLIIDEKYRMQGRGAYICKSEDCLRKCIKSKGFQRAFKRKVEDSFYNELLNKIKENCGDG